MERHYLMTPGPTPVPEAARLAMARQLIHHRGEEFKGIFGEVREGLRWFFETEAEVLTLTCSGTGAFEAAMTNCTGKGDRVVCIGGGKFAERWAKMGRAFGLDVVELPVEWGEAARPDELAKVLEEAGEVSMVTAVASETSTGTYHPVRELAQVVRERSEALFVVDGITAVGVHRMPMDEWGLDVVVSGSQKALGIPPGLGFVALSDRAWTRAEESDHPRFYFDLLRERDRQAQDQTAFTPAVSVVLALREVLALMRAEGREGLLNRHRRNAEATQAGVQAMGLRLFSQSPSRAVTAARVPEGLSGGDIRARMGDDHGVVIAGGQGPEADSLIRLGHIGFFDAPDILLTLGALEETLGALGAEVDPGSGVAAAQRVFRDL